MAMIKVRRNTDDIYSLARFNSTGGDELHRQFLECGLFVLLPRRRAKERRCMNRALLCALVVIRACDLLLSLNQNFPVCSGKFMLISGWILARLAQW